MKFLPDIPEYNKLAWITSFLIILFGFSTLFGQVRQDLENQRKKLIQEIANTSAKLERTKKTKAAALERYVALQNQIQARERLILTLQQELLYVDEKFSQTSDVVTSLSLDVSKLEEEYAQMLRQAYRQKATKSSLLFLFSSESINQIFKRWQYLKQYDSYRKKQALIIQKTRETLLEKMEQLQKRKHEKELLIEAEVQQQEILNKEFKLKSNVISSLKTSESRLVKELEDQKKAHERLNKAIEEIIRKEVAKTRSSSRTNTIPDRGGNTFDISAESSNFNSYKGRLPWPVDQGSIERYFGIQPHPTIQNINITNNGIDVLTDAQANAYAVFPGKVVGVQFVPGHDYMLIIQHGNYYSVYSNLEEAKVEKNQEVKAGTRIGTVSIDAKTQKSIIHFEIWYNKTRLNPSEWLRKSAG